MSCPRVTYHIVHYLNVSSCSARDKRQIGSTYPLTQTMDRKAGVSPLADVVFAMLKDSGIS